MGSGSGAGRPGDAADEPVRVWPYNPAWPARFDDERQVLQQAIGEFATGGIHHVGSTSVPWLDAKPIIDILVGVRDLQDAHPCIGLVAPLGYVHAPYRAAEMLWFCKPHPRHRTHHLHLVPVSSARFRDELRFRDYLRSHDQARAEYSRLKHNLAERFRCDRDAYTQSKTAFVQDILRRTATTG